MQYTQFQILSYLMLTLLSNTVQTSLRINCHVFEQIDVDELSQVSGLARADVTVSSPTLVACAVECLEQPNCSYFVTSSTQCGLLSHISGLSRANLTSDDDIIVMQHKGNFRIINFELIDYNRVRSYFTLTHAQVHVRAHTHALCRQVACFTRTWINT